MKALILFLFLFIFTLEHSYSVCTRQKAIMYLPPNGKSIYTKFMQGRLNADIPKDIDKGSPIVASYAEFPDGNYVFGGVLKSGQTEYNSIFMWAFRPNGTQFPEWPLDVSDVEDFEAKSMIFELDGCEYELEIKERSSLVQ